MRMRTVLVVACWLGVASPVAAQAPAPGCAVGFPPLTPDLIAIALGSGSFMDPTYVNTIAAIGYPPCVTWAQTTPGLSAVWTLTFNQPTPAATTQVQIFAVSAGAWSLDIPSGEAPAFTLMVPTPAPNADGTYTVTLAPALDPTQIYRASIVGVSGTTPPFAAAVVGTPTSLTLPAIPTNLHIGGSL